LRGFEEFGKERERMLSKKEERSWESRKRDGAE
jgi:hypothetical protein